MRLPPSLLARVRGPLALLALTGCASPPAVETAPAIVDVIAEPAVPAAPPPDVVPYDEELEAVRLARADTALASDADRRSERIVTADRRTTRRESDAVSQALLGYDSITMTGCGRG